MEIDYVVIGKRIRELRNSKGLTQSELGEIAGVEASNISHIERAATKLSLPTLINIANALNSTLDELVYSNLIRSSHVSIELINDLISDCTADEIKALVEVIKTTKNVLRNK